LGREEVTKSGEIRDPKEVNGIGEGGWVIVSTGKNLGEMNRAALGRFTNKSIKNYHQDLKNVGGKGASQLLGA